MAPRVIVAGVTGWTGRAVAEAVIAAPDLFLVGAVARSAAGRDAGELLAGSLSGVTVRASVAEALALRRVREAVGLRRGLDCLIE